MEEGEGEGEEDEEGNHKIRRIGSVLDQSVNQIYSKKMGAEFLNFILIIINIFI